MMKLVLDTDVVVAAFRSRLGASAELLRMAGAGRFLPVVSVALVLEYEAVLTRPEQLNDMGLDHAAATSLLDGLVALSKPAAMHYRHRPAVNDATDEMVLETAINGGAAAIVTFNRRDFGTGPSRYGIGCWLPREALEYVR